MFRNVAIDFSKAQVVGNNRNFDSGFVSAKCAQISDKKKLPALPPGLVLLGDSGSLPCDSWEDTPSFFMSHDLIFNFGHTVSDFWIVWTTAMALELDVSRFQLVNMDGIRGNGPAGRGTRLTLAEKPDHLSPFFEQYRAWFGQGVRRSVDYGARRVCFREAVFQVRIQVSRGPQKQGCV